MPTVLRKYGYRFHFYGSDMHEPPHIHVTGHAGKAKIWLEPVEMAGVSYDPLRQRFSIGTDCSVNYMLACRRAG